MKILDKSKDSSRVLQSRQSNSFKSDIHADIVGYGGRLKLYPDTLGITFDCSGYALIDLYEKMAKEGKNVSYKTGIDHKYGPLFTLESNQWYPEFEKIGNESITSMKAVSDVDLSTKKSTPEYIELKSIIGPAIDKIKVALSLKDKIKNLRIKPSKPINWNKEFDRAEMAGGIYDCPVAVLKDFKSVINRIKSRTEDWSEGIESDIVGFISADKLSDVQNAFDEGLLDGEWFQDFDPEFKKLYLAFSGGDSDEPDEPMWFHFGDEKYPCSDIISLKAFNEMAKKYPWLQLKLEKGPSDVRIGNSRQSNSTKSMKVIDKSTGRVFNSRQSNSSYPTTFNYAIIDCKDFPIGRSLIIWINQGIPDQSDIREVLGPGQKFIEGENNVRYDRFVSILNILTSGDITPDGVYWCMSPDDVRRMFLGGNLLSQFINGSNSRMSNSGMNVQSAFTQFERLVEGSGITKDSWKKFFIDNSIKNSSDFEKLIDSWKSMADKGELKSNYVDDSKSWDEYLKINMGEVGTMKDQLEECKKYADGDFGNW